jgi:hypothetical protein
VLILQGHDPFTIWSLPKPQAIALLPLDSLDSSLGQTIRAFYQAVQVYYPFEELDTEGLAVIETGVRFLQAVKSWWLEKVILNYLF